MDTLGVVECKSIAVGAKLADEMMKAGQVALVRAGSVCSGRFLIYVAGQCEAVKTVVEYARSFEQKLVGSFVLSGISPQVLAALKKSVRAKDGDALGVVESRIVSSGVAAADLAVKSASVTLLRIVSGSGINGKSYFIIGGDVAAVAEATEAAQKALGKDLIGVEVIAGPDSSVVDALTGTVR